MFSFARWKSHLKWPVFGTRDYLIATSATDKAFSAQLQSWMAGEMNWTFDPNHADNWRDILELRGQNALLRILQSGDFLRSHQGQVS